VAAVFGEVVSAVVIAAAFGAAIAVSRALVFVAAIEASQEPVIAPVRADVIAASPAGVIGVSTVVADTHVGTIAGVMDRGTGVAMGVIATTIEATGMRFLGGCRPQVILTTTAPTPITMRTLNGACADTVPIDLRPTPSADMTVSIIVAGALTAVDGITTVSPSVSSLK